MMKEKVELGYQLSVERLSAHMGYSRDAYYKARSRQKHVENQWDDILSLVHRERSLQARLSGKKVYHIIKPELLEKGIKMGRDKFYDLLRSYGLLIERKVKQVRTTNSAHSWRRYKNLLVDKVIDGPNQVWVSDITYLSTHEGFVYLCLIMDAYSRQIVGWAVHDSLEMQGCLNALKRAVKTLPKSKNGCQSLIHHSDQGVQYCCKAYTTKLKKHKIIISMASKGNCYENAKAERLNGILKQEYGLGLTMSSKKAAKKLAAQAIELYNHYRPHLALKMHKPNDVHSGKVKVDVRMSWAKKQSPKAA